MDLTTKLRKFRIKFSIMLLIVILPAIIFKIAHSNNINIDNSSIFMASVFIYILVCMILMFVFLFMLCPSCNKGYFSKSGLPKLFYRLKCQSCGFNAFTSHNKAIKKDV